MVRDTNNRVVSNARLELRDFRTGTLAAQGYTRPNGAFELVAPDGEYELIVQQGVSEARQRVSVGTFETNVVVQLTTASSSGVGGATTVSVAALRAPKKARKEFAKAEEAYYDGNFESALKHLAKALEVFPKFANALALKGILLLREKQVEQAAVVLDQAIHADPGYALSYTVLASACNSQGRWDDALRAVERAVALAPASWQAHFEKARALLGKGDFDRALRAINAAATRDGKGYPPIHLVRAHAFIGLKNYQAAIMEFEQFIRTEPDGADAMRARQSISNIKAFAARSAK